MEFSDVIACRRSIRKYRAARVPQAKLRRLYKALQTAPSGANRQDYTFIFVTDPDKRHRIATEACHQEFVDQAPVIMVACCGRDGAFDAAIAVDHLVLAATNEGLGTCWVGWFERDVVRRILDIPADKEVPILVPIGFPDESPKARERKPISELIRLDSYAGRAR